MRISSITIAKNEEQNIGRCIRSLLSCADEIIVLVDKDSHDRTLEIVQSFPDVTCSVIVWKGYSKTKQAGLQKASNDWIFWIDADEEVTPELANEIQIFKTQPPHADAYSVSRKAYFLGKWIKHSGWYPGRVERLFNKNRVSFSDNEVHEKLIIDGKTSELTFDLNHYTDPSIQHYYEKFNLYTGLAAKELFLKQKSFSIPGLIFRPMFLFVKMYILRLGFLDGLHGLVLAVFSANYVFTKYAKLWQLERESKHGK